MNAPSRCSRRPRLPGLSDAERAEVHRLLEQFSIESEDRRAAHIAKLERAAFWIGKTAGLGDVTIDAAAKRLEAMATATDPTAPIPILIVPIEEAHEILEHAFARGVDAARKGTTT